MSNPFDEFKPAPAASAFDEFAPADPPTNVVMRQAVKVKPDAAAEADRLARRYPAPYETIKRNADDFQMFDIAEGLAQELDGAPTLAGAFRKNPRLAEMAHDDIGVLSKITGALGDAARYAVSAPGTKRGLAGDAVDATKTVGLGATVGVGKAIFDVAAVINDLVGWDSGAAGMRGMAKRAGESMDAAGMEAESSTGKAVKSGLQSAGTNLAMLPLGLARGLYSTASQAATTVAGLMGLTVGADAFNEKREAGGGKLAAAAFGIPQGVFEFVFEKIPASKLFGDLAANAGLWNTLKHQAFSETWTEQATTLAQDFNSWMNLHPEKTAAEFLAERPEAAYQTMVATLVGVGVQTTTIHGLNKAIEKATDQRLQFQQDAFEQLQKLASQSALRERSPEQFRALIQQVVGQSDSAQKSIHVDAQVLSQLGEDVLAQLPESVRAQIPAEAAKNGTVEIGMADVLTVAPGTPLEQILNDHARMTPESMSRADAQAAGDQSQVLRQEAEQVIQQAADQQVAQAEYNQVQQMYAQQVAASGRYRPAVADQMGHWLASFYTAYGARTGVTATQMQARYPVRVLGVASTDAQGHVMDQPGTSNFDKWFGDSKVRDAEGKPLVVYHGTTGDFSTFSRVDGGNAYGPGFYFTEDPIEASGYAEGTGGARIRPRGDAAPNVMPVYLSAQNVFTLDDRLLTKAEIGKLETASNKLTPGAWKKGALAKSFDNAYRPNARNVMQFITEQAGGTYTELAQAAGYDGLKGDYGYVAFKPAQIKSAVGNNGNYDPKNLSVLGQAARLQVVVSLDENGLPEIHGDGVFIGFGQPAERFEFIPADDGETMLNQAIMSPDGAYQGYVEATHKAGKPVAIYDIYVDPESRKQGVGERAVKAMLDASGGTLRVSNVVPAAQGFWEKVGVPIQNVEEGAAYDGTITAENFNASAAGQKRAAARGTVGQNQGTGPGAAGQAEGTLEQRESGFARFVGDATRVDLGDSHEFVAGEPVVVAALHGTTGDFTAFDAATANIESDLGGGFYFTNNPADVGENYAGMGSDLTQKIQIEAGRLESNEDMDSDEAKRVARDKWMANEGLTMPVWVKMTNPVVLGGSRETFLSYEEAYDEETDEYGEPTGDLIEIVEALREVAGDARYDDHDIEQTIGQLMGRAMDSGGLSARELIATAKLSEGLVYAVDYEADGKLAPQEILRRAFESAGFDGFIDQTVDEKFGSSSEGQRKYGKGMKGMDADTVHFIAFTPTQIKSRLGNDGTFDANDPSILSQREAQTPRGTFNPRTLDLVLNPNANLSTWFHETGHFFLEVMGDIASQPDAPAQIVEDMNTFLKWAGVKDLATWNGLDLEGKRAAHERWAESIEQYVMEGKAPSLELQPLMRRFATWLKSVYGSIKAFLASRGQAAPGGAALRQADDNAFKRWFGGSKVVDENGEPLVVYHGTGKKFAAFDIGRESKNFGTFGEFTVSRLGAFFAADKKFAARFKPKGGKLVQAFLSLQNPVNLVEGYPSEVWEKLGPVLKENNLLNIPADGMWELFDKGFPGGVEFVQALKDAGYDGAKIGERDADGNLREVYVAFKPEQIKSAAGNDGTFDANDPSILSQDPNAQPGPQMALNDDIRRVMDRMLATDEQIAQANEVSGLLPDLEADGTAEERLRKRSMADLKWAVRAKDAVIAKLRKQARAVEKGIRAEVTAEVNQMREVQAKDTLAKSQKENGGKLNDTERAIIADAFGYETVDQMMLAIDAFGSKADVIDGMTQQRMLQEHGDLTDEDAIRQAALEAVHNEARARSLATELRTQREMLNSRQDTGEVNAKGSKITVNALVEAAKQFAANVVARTPLRDLKSKAWQHTAAERRAGQRWQEATAAGKTQEAVQAKQDQMLNNAAAKAALDARQEMGKILEFFKRVVKGNDEKVVEKGRDADVVNAARAVLATYGIETPASKGAAAYLETLQRNDPDLHAVVAPMVEAATRNAQPIEALTFEELQALHEEIAAMWHLAKSSRQMEVDGDKMDVEDAAAEVRARMEDIGIPDEIPGETGALTKKDERVRWLQFAGALLRRVEQWAEGMDGKFGGPFLRYIYQPVKEAANRYRTDKVEYRKKFQALVDAVAPTMTHQLIAAPELGYTFGRGHNGIGHAELLHALLHTGNESNKRKLLLGRNWAVEGPDGQLDASKWDAFIARLVNGGVLQPAHYNFAQGVWDLLEETKPLAQKAHRDVFGRYFAEVTADPFTDPWGQARRGGYVPAQADPNIVNDADIRALAEAENESMAYSFPTTSKGFTKARVEYNRPLKLDLRTIPQHIDKVLLFSHMEPAVRGVSKLLRQKTVSQALSRIDPSAYSGMLLPWLNRSAKQIVETPTMGDGKVSRVLSTLRSRAGAALMFANISNTVQQLTGFSSAAVKVRPAHLMRATAQMIAHPKQTRAAVAATSEYMATRMDSEVAAMTDAMNDILLNPSLYEKSQGWATRHSYFLQSALDNSMSPAIWTGAYNQALEEKMSDADAVRFADSVVRQTQGANAAEDVSRIETGPAYARIFTQFIGYFNMLANTNGTALKQIAGEMGLKKGAGKALGVVFYGMLAPIWIAEAIAQAFRGGPDDKDKDGYLDDWLAAVFGMGTIKGMLAQVPFVAQVGQVVVNRFNTNPADDRFSLSPAVSLLESAASVPHDVYKMILGEGNAQRTVRDAAALASLATGLPATALARPLGYAAGVADNKIQPTGPADAARGLITGTASPASKVK